MPPHSDPSQSSRPSPSVVSKSDGLLPLTDSHNVIKEVMIASESKKDHPSHLTRTGQHPSQKRQYGWPASSI